MLRSNEINIVYVVELLNFGKALCLLLWKALKRINPLENYKELCKQAIEYTKGIPLTIAILGSFLWSKRSTIEWENALRKLRDNQRKDIIDALKISFANHEEIDKHISLNIAYFFKKYDKNLVIEILDSCGFDTEYEITNLVDKSLLSI